MGISDEKIQRIKTGLARRQAEGLTEEKKEQQLLRKEFLASSA